MTPREMRFAVWRANPGRPALVALLEASQARVFAICRDVLEDRHEAEEAAQESLLKIVLGIERVRDGEHYEHWSGQVAHRTALDRRRSLRRRQAREREGARRGRSNGHPWDAVHEAIERLPADERELIVERYFDQRTFEAMGRRRGLSDVGVRKRIRKAHDRLKRMLGGGLMLFAGASLVKAKTAASIAVILIPLLMLGGGVWVATAKRSARFAEVAGVPLPKQEAVISTPAKVAPKPPEPAGLLEGPLDRTRLRAEIVACWARLTYAHRRAAECKRIWPDATTREEFLRLSNEKTALDAEARDLHKRLPELAAADPAVLIDLVRHGRDLEGRLRLMGLVAPDIEAELGSENAPGGPLLSALLTLAAGDSEEKTYLAAFAGQLTRANRELGKTLVGFLEDPDFHVRVHAAQSLATLAHRDVLRPFLSEQVPALMVAALREGDRRDLDCHQQVLRLLATIGSELSDDFVLQQVERVESGHDFDRVTAAAIAAPRLVARHEARLTLAILKGLQVVSDPSVYHLLLHVAQSLPEASRRTIHAAAVNGPEPPMGGVPIPGSSRAGINRGPQRNLTGVSRWELKPPVSESPIKRIEW